MSPVSASAAGLRRLKGMARGETTGGALVSLIYAGLFAVASFVMFALASRSMGPAQFGTFAVWFNAMSFLAMVAGLGQETLIMRLWHEYLGRNRFGHARGALLFGWLVTGTSALAVAAMTAAVAYLLGFAAALIAAGCLFLLVETLMTYSAHSTRVIIGIPFADGHRELTWRSIVIASILAIGFQGSAVTAPAVLACAAAGMLLVVIIHSLAVLRRLPPDVRKAPARMRVRQWAGRSLNMWYAAVAEAASQFLEVIIIGVLLSPVAAGGFFIAQKLANIFSIIAGGLSMYATRRISGHYFKGEHDKLHGMLATLAAIALLLVTVAVATVLIAGDLVLSIFGDAYREEFATLVILVLGTAGVALAGPAPYLLMLTGHEAVYSRTMTVILILRLSALAVMAPLWGTVGAAAAWSGAALIGAVWLNFRCRRLTRLDPSVFILLQSSALPANLRMTGK